MRNQDSGLTWEIAQKSSYLSDFIDLNKSLQKAVVRALGMLEKDPTSPRGNTVRKLKGFEDVWRYRLGDFRLIYHVVPPSQLIRLLAVGPRSSVYKRFNYNGWDAPYAAIEFGPQMTAAPEWTKHPEWFAPDQAPGQKKLPRKLTPSLLKRWRIDGQFYPALTRCNTEEDLMRAVGNGVPSDVLTRVMEGLYPASVEQIASQPDQLLIRPADLIEYAEGTLSAFLLRLDEDQKPLVNWAISGPTLVKGGPGSGKSTVGLYRLRALAEHFFWKTGRLPRILFTTYTRALTNFSESLLRQLLRDLLSLGPLDPLPKEVRISTMYQIQREIAGCDGRYTPIADSSIRYEALRNAREALTLKGLKSQQRHRVKSVLAELRDEYLLAEFDWVIEGQDCRTEADYLASERTGRGIRFQRSLRLGVWELFQLYRAYLMKCRRYTYGHMVQLALDKVKDGSYKDRWDYIIVDEAQDLAPAAIGLCVELCKSPKGIFLTADANQSLYNRGFRWTYVHEDLNVRGRTRILNRNYRSTKEIAVAASQILEASIDCDGEALVQEYVYSGAFPVLYAAAGTEDQARWIGRQIYEAARELRLPPNSAVVLVSLSDLGESLARKLNLNGVPAVFMRSRDFDLEDPRVKVTTLHAAKGLEFPIVVIAHAEEDVIPWSTRANDPGEISEFIDQQRRLFYVGCTRAMRYLFVSYNRDQPSPFLDELRDDCWMRLEV